VSYHLTLPVGTSTSFALLEWTLPIGGRFSLTVARAGTNVGG